MMTIIHMQIRCAASESDPPEGYLRNASRRDGVSRPRRLPSRGRLKTVRQACKSKLRVPGTGSQLEHAGAKFRDTASTQHRTLIPWDPALGTRDPTLG